MMILSIRIIYTQNFDYVVYLFPFSGEKTQLKEVKNFSKFYLKSLTINQNYAVL